MAILLIVFISLLLLLVFFVLAWGEVTPDDPELPKKNKKSIMRVEKK